MKEITDKQLEVLKLLAEGHTSDYIAKELGNAKQTIDSIRIDMLRRFGVRNVAHLITHGFRQGWLK
ncbi:MAG: LuxR C-terminal-related transcriptional regulator [Reichenbachiella sp.]|uniref:LuxR C-terminal-related transcriptional regulator n=1 Tax=Reichenbachiella sp. TaxID=2184521 RepID=UPI003265427D